MKKNIKVLKKKQNDNYVKYSYHEKKYKKKFKKNYTKLILFSFA